MQKIEESLPRFGIVNELSLGVLTQLFNGDIGAIQVPLFIPIEQCRIATQNILAHGFDYYKGVEPPIGHIGITQFEHADSLQLKKEYFDRSETANRERESLFVNSQDPIRKLIFKLRSLGIKTNIASEKDGKLYFAGLVRIISEALLHIDYAPRDAVGWDIENVNAQITWNVMLQSTKRGGQSIVYKRPWEIGDDRCKIKGSYGYNPDMVSNTESANLIPRAGDLFMFNSRNFHKVSSSGVEDRITCGSFIGRKNNGELVLWS